MKKGGVKPFNSAKGYGFIQSLRETRRPDDHRIDPSSNGVPTRGVHSSDTTKHCSTCKSVLPLEEFHLSKSGRKGRASRCRQCAKKITTEWRASNKDRKREYAKRYRKANGAKKKACKRIELPKKQEEFCHHYLFSTRENASKAALLCGVSTWTGRFWIHKPEIQKRLDELRAEYRQELEKLRAARAKKELLDEEFVDQPG